MINRTGRDYSGVPARHAPSLTTLSSGEVIELSTGITINPITPERVASALGGGSGVR